MFTERASAAADAGPGAKNTPVGGAGVDGSTGSNEARASGHTGTLAQRLGPGSFRFGAGALWIYGCLVMPFGRVVGASRGGVATAVSVVAGLLVIGWIIRGRRISAARMLDLGIACTFFVALLLVVDVTMSVRDNFSRARAGRDVADSARISDSTIWHGELYPRTYVPEGQRFSIYKPNVRLTGETYGERYVPSMLRSPTLVQSVLERRQLSYFIGPEGFRELDPLSESRIFALGDSFAFGFATDEGKTWPDRLGAALGEPVYNLGVSATGPGPQLELFEYLLNKHRGAMPVRQLLWMIFEGNDLENAYDASPVLPAQAGGSSLIQGTILEPVAALPSRVRSQSAVRRLLTGDLRLSAGNRRYGQYEIDGVALPVPLFHSARFGYRLFTPADIEAATQPREYVRTHPNRPRLDAVFQRMQALSLREGFTVTVVLAPSDARLYGAAYEGFPTLSTEPHFLDYVAGLAAEMRFPVINLLPLLQPVAATEMLYYRDDHHWNERGNEVVASLIAGILSSR